jgi:hypothetical protein
VKINWGGILNAGLVAEILLIGVYQIFAWLHGSFDLANYIFASLGSFVFMLIATLWVSKKIESRFILHGALVGMVAVIYYVIRSLPEYFAGTYAANYWLAVVVGHPPKILGGMLGGFLALRMKKL